MAYEFVPENKTNLKVSNRDSVYVQKTLEVMIE